MSGTSVAGTVECSGFLFFNDTHIASSRPDRRKDDYTQATLAKLDFIISEANARRLVPMCTGDLLDVARERDDSIKTRIQRILAKCWTRAGIINPGNHDMEGGRLSDKDSLAIIGTSGLIRVPRDSGAVDTFIIHSETGNSYRMGVGATPYGQTIPDDVSGMFAADVGGVVWMTHHDLAIGGTYPGAIPLKEIKGCLAVFNGHMHDAKPAEQCGETWWMNFGSVARTSVSAINHVPMAWVFRPDMEMEPIGIPHTKNVFNLTGRLIRAAGLDDADILPADELDERKSVFVSLLMGTGVDSGRTDSAVFIKEELDRRLAEGTITPAAHRYLNDLRIKAVSP